MPLTDTAIRNAKPGDKPVKLSDERGLFLLISPAGGKWWRFKYRFDGKHKTLSMGVYPDVGLKEARERRDETRKQVAAGIDPGENRKAMKSARADRAANSFEVVAREWHLKYARLWVFEHADKVVRRLEREVFPWLGARPVREITAPEILTVLRRIEARGALDTAHRVHQNLGRIFHYAIATGRAERNPAIDIRGALPPFQGGHHAAIVEPKAVGGLLRALDGYQGTPEVRASLRLAPLLFVRPGELRKAEWNEIDIEAAEWRIPGNKMKTGEPHLVPLSGQAIAVLTELRLLTGSGRYIFPGVRSASRPMSENTVNAALRRLGYAKEQMVGHGFRATARTILDEVLGFPAHLIEHQLAHAVRDPLGRAYNRTAHLPARRAMMQKWADYLDGLKHGADVVPLHYKLT